MATKTLYVGNDYIWDLLRDYAELTNKSVSALVEIALDEYLSKHVGHHRQVLLADLFVKAGYTPKQAETMAMTIINKDWTFEE